jgi:uncharacterized protein YsxB (DUF464 family)
VVKVSFEQKDSSLILKLEGHAGQADIGHDIVCASCSILTYTVAQFVKDAETSGCLKTPAEIVLESGHSVISCKPTDDMLIDIQNIYLFAETGYTLLAHNYPQFVDLKRFGEPYEA